MTGAPLVIAQSAGGAAGNLFGDLLPWLGLLVVIVLIGGGIAIWTRRRLMSGDAAGSVGFTLGDLRDLHTRGEISTEEFEKAKSQMIAGLTRRDEISGPESSTTSESQVRGEVPPPRRGDSGGNHTGSATEGGNG
ncbi:MAG: hypothetical protein RLZZ461_1586 [Planctomycetota bacterium]